MLLRIVKVAQSLTICQKPLALDNMSCYYLGVKQKFCKGEVRMKKIILTSLFSIILIASMTFCANADEVISVYVNGYKVEFDVQPQLIKDRTMVPMRKIFEAMGANIQWDETTQTVTAKKSYAEGKYNIVEMQIDNNIMKKDGTDIVLDVPPTIIDDRTLVPVRAVSEAFNAEVQWSERNNSVVIGTGNYKLYKDYYNIPDFGDFFNIALSSSQYNDITYTESFQYSTPVSKLENFNLEAYANILSGMGWNVYEHPDDALSLNFLNLDDPSFIFSINIGLDGDKSNAIFEISIKESMKVFTIDGEIKILPLNQVEQMEENTWGYTFPLAGRSFWIHRDVIIDSENRLGKWPDEKLYDLPSINQITIVDYKENTILYDNAGTGHIKKVIVDLNGQQYIMDTAEFTRLFQDGIWEDSDGTYSADPKSSYGISDYNWDRIQLGLVWIGMSKTELLLAKGTPDDINRTVTDVGTIEQLVYTIGDNMSFYYIQDGVLTGWQD